MLHTISYYSANSLFLSVGIRRNWRKGTNTVLFILLLFITQWKEPQTSEMISKLSRVVLSHYGRQKKIKSLSGFLSTQVKMGRGRASLHFVCKHNGIYYLLRRFQKGIRKPSIWAEFHSPLFKPTAYGPGLPEKHSSYCTQITC